MTGRARRIAWGALAAGLAAGVWAGYPFARFLYGWETNGPPAIHRLPVSPPTWRYRYGPSPRQLAELRMPPGRGPFPLVVTIHGGCFLRKIDDAAGFAPFADALTRRGLATLNVEYRILGDAGAGWPNSYRDVGAGVDLARLVARRFPVDLARVTIVGHSAGAHFAVWAASRAALPAASAVRGRDPLRPAAVVAIDGPPTLTPFVGPDAEECGEPVIVPLLGGTPAQVPERYREADPAARLPLGIPQGFVPAALGESMTGYVARARAAGDPISVYRPDIPSHFRIVNPERPQGRAVIDLVVRLATAPPAPPRPMPAPARSPAPAG